jgi:NAD(P)-dependent dehydrogenase (short-subunit alcohol dehydrogenase family)
MLQNAESEEGNYEMNSLEIKTLLITGANAGIGKEVARQTAMREGVERVYLACRNDARARAAKQELEQQTGKRIFKIILMDVSDVGNVRSALNGLQEPIDALVMNAGGAGGKTPLRLTRDGVTEIFATNVLGHVALLESLVASDRLTQSAVYLGSEAARGVPKMGMKRPALPTSSVEDFVDVITGKDFAGKKFSGVLAYSEVEYIAALWMAYQARIHPNLRFIIMSPGNTQGTEIANGYPTPLRILMKYVMMPIVAPLMGMAHSLQTGAGRIVSGLTDSTLKSGVFYGSGPQTLTGPVMNQSEIFPDLANEAIQQHADRALHRFL